MQTLELDVIGFDAVCPLSVTRVLELVASCPQSGYCPGNSGQTFALPIWRHRLSKPKRVLEILDFQ